ncbi:MAG TPA: maleylpyruvate isomerase N-terminal domain-containing protein [Propionibacteriaceae bacterium]|nr:maleylpyruvate isomerase N-terminal domain-containing protein [Propionibacteriaceae bacterium]
MTAQLWLVRYGDHTDVEAGMTTAEVYKEARVLASTEVEKFASLTASLTPKEWATDTDCVGWNVRKVTLHVLGSADAQASPTSRPQLAGPWSSTTTTTDVWSPTSYGSGQRSTENRSTCT